MATRHRLKHDVVATLRIRRPVPRSVKRDKYAVAIALRKLLPVVVHHAVRCPMRGKSRRRCELACAYTALLPITTIFRRQNQFLHEPVVVAFGPSVVAALLQ